MQMKPGGFQTTSGKPNRPQDGINRRSFLTAAAGLATLASAPTTLALQGKGAKAKAGGETGRTEGGARRLVRVWNRPVDPASHPGAKLRPHPAVTWEDLGGENVCHTIALRYFEIKQGENGVRRVVNYKETLDLFTKFYDFGRAIAPHYKFLFTENYKEVVDEIKARGLLLHHVWGYEPANNRSGDDPGPVPREANDYLVKVFGRRFTGFDNGEHDCGYTLGMVNKYPYPKNRQEGWEHFMDYEFTIAEELQHNFTALSNNTFQPYMADIGDTRMIGCQIAQSKPNVPMWCALLRGAAKQHGLLYWVSPSLFNRWGWREQGAKSTELEGASVSLLHRLWHVSYMYGVAIIMSEAASFDRRKMVTLNVDGAERRVPVPDPTAQQHLQIKDWIRKHPARGVMHTPVAIIWDFYAGWIPPRRTPADGRPFHTWGIMPYEKGDYQIDALFRELYPGYEDASYYRDERGFLTATPWGDSCDVLMSITPRFVLNRYNAAVIIGPTKIEGQLLQTVEDFATRGGSVATTAAQLTSESAALFGVRWTGKTVTDRYAKLPSGLGFSEASFTRHVLEPLDGTEILAANYTGEPLALRRRTQEGGDMLVFAADFGLSDKVAEQPSIAAENVPIVPSHLMLQHVKSILMPWMAQWNLIEVDGLPVQFLTNLTDSANTLIVTLCNNAPFEWKGAVRLKGAQIASGSNWMTGEKVVAGDAMHLTIEPHDVVIVQLSADHPLVAFRDDEGPEPTPAELERKSAALFAKLAAEKRK